MGVREDVLRAARSLTERGFPLFSPAELIAEARSHGSGFQETSLRTHIVCYMCINAGGAYGGKFPDLVRVDHGLYRLVDGASIPQMPERPSVPDRPQRIEADVPRSHRRHEWFWEGNVQAAVVRHLAGAEWRVLRVADTERGEHGVDIEADRQGERLLVEVKGYPGTLYARGDRQGMTKRTNAATQARAYFSHAVLAGLLMRSESTGARVVLTFPAMATFEHLAHRVAAPLTSAGIEVWLVHEDGTVTERVTG
jgi:hypothetical protein